MKTTLTILLSGLLLCGCSQQQATSARPAIDLVEAGKNITWRDGYVLRVAKRDGTFLEGIQISSKTPAGQKTTITADTGTISPFSVQNTTDDSAVQLALHNAKLRTGAESTTLGEFTIVLHK